MTFRPAEKTVLALTAHHCLSDICALTESFLAL